MGMGTVLDLRQQQPPLLDSAPGNLLRMGAFRPSTGPDMARCIRRNYNSFLGRAAADRNGSSTGDAVMLEAPSLTALGPDNASAAMPIRSTEAADAAHLATLVSACLRTVLHATGRRLAMHYH